MSYNIDAQDTLVIDHFAIDRRARALRAEATSNMIADLRAWVSSKLSAGSFAAGKAA